MKPIFLALIFLTMQSNNTFKIKMVGFNNDNGKAMLRVRDASGKLLFEKTSPIVNKQSVVEFPLGATQTIGVEAFHDENNNDKIDKNFVGVPTEKWGVSSNNRPMLKAPELKDILVPVKANSTILIKLD